METGDPAVGEEGRSAEYSRVPWVYQWQIQDVAYGGGRGWLYLPITYIRPRDRREIVSSKQSSAFAYNSNSKRSPQHVNASNQTPTPQTLLPKFLGPPEDSRGGSWP